MSKIHDILLVEDDEDDFVLTRDLLSETFGGGFKLDWVTTWDSVLEALRGDVHDVYGATPSVDRRNHSKAGP